MTDYKDDEEETLEIEDPDEPTLLKNLETLQLV